MDNDNDGPFFSFPPKPNKEVLEKKDMYSVHHIGNSYYSIWLLYQIKMWSFGIVYMHYNLDLSIIEETFWKV